MRIIDFHTHIFPDALAPRALAALLCNCRGGYQPVTDMTKSSLLARMDEWGIDLSVVQPVVTKPTQVKTINDWAAAIRSDRLISFGGIYPTSDSWKSDIDMVVEKGLPGIKLHPEYQSFVLDDPAMLRVYDYALSKGLILFFHAGYDPAVKPPFRSDPKRFAHVLDAMRGGTIVAAHLGSQSMWDEVEQYLCGRDIWLDTSMGFSYYSAEQFVRIVKSHSADRILFASDSPWSCAKEELDAFSALPLSEEEKKAILGGNACRLLGL